MAEHETRYPSLDTPVVLDGLNTLEANLGEMSRLAAGVGVKLRPQIKVHANVSIAEMQVDAGACGVDVGDGGEGNTGDRKGTG